MCDILARLTHIASCRPLVAAILLGLLLTGVLPVSLEAARGGGGKTEVLPVQKAAPAAVFIETPGTEADLRRQLRAKNAVVELGASTPKVLFSQAPTGAYGFIVPKLLGLALVTQSPDIGIERIASAANAYEIHKLADGSGMLVGFVALDLISKVTPSQRPKNIRLALHSNPSDKATHIVAVPLVKLVADRMPIRLDPKNPDGPVVFDMDLQGSTSRASTQGGQ
ncbi:MAG: hypothetical protein ACXWWE_07725 [Nitrospira sp.]